jgi:DNA-binding transcriptional LysR family regulator
VVAPALSQLIAQYPALQLRLEVFDRIVDVAAEGFDLDVRVGDEIAPHLIARHLADNHRVLCAAPAYVQRRGSRARWTSWLRMTAWSSRSATIPSVSGNCARAVRSAA